MRERSFLISTGITLGIVIIVLVLPALLGFGGPNEYTIAAGDQRGQAVVERAVALADEFEATVTIGDASPDARLTDGEIRAEELARRQAPRASCRSPTSRSRSPAHRRCGSSRPSPMDPDRDAKAGLAFFVILILYGQLLTYGFWVATGVVEEKASRVIEILLATIRRRTCWRAR